MIRVRSEWFLPRTIQKLHIRGADPFKVLKIVGPNAYVIDLPPDYGISPTSNVSNLIEYKEPALISSDPFKPVPSFERDPPLLVHKPNFKKKHDVIDRILDKQIKSIRGQDYCYLVCWRGRLESKDSWITQEELQKIQINIKA